MPIKKVNNLNLEWQEHLSPVRLKKITHSTFPYEVTKRPQSNLIDILNWVDEIFCSKLFKGKTVRFIHNNFYIDGSFIQFCEENKITLSCLVNESVLSRSEGRIEKFSAQGVYKIDCNSFSFIYASLFRKTNRVEDEIVSFVVVPENMSEQYLALRNHYEYWLSCKEKLNGKIHVIDGADQPILKNQQWNDLFISDVIKNDLNKSIINFLSSNSLYKKVNLPWKYGVLVYGGEGLGKTSLINTIISNFDLKPVTVSQYADDESIRNAFYYADSQAPSILYFDNLDLTLQNASVLNFINCLDNVSANEAVLIIVALKSLDNLPHIVVDRLVNFNKVIKLQHPDQDLSFKFLKNIFKSTVADVSLKEIVKTTCHYNFNYSLLKELFITTMLNVSKKNNKKVTIEDLRITLNEMVEKKSLLRSKIVGLEKV